MLPLEVRWREIKAGLLAADPKVYGVCHSHPSAYFSSLIPAALQAHPVNDPSVQYTHIELSSRGPVWFTIRWWDGDDFRTFLDLVDVHDQTRVLCPRLDLNDLEIDMTYMGMTFRLNTLEEKMRRARGVSQEPSHSKECYVAPPGARLYIYRRDSTPAGSRRHIANVYVPVPAGGHHSTGLGLWPRVTSYWRR